MPCVFLHLCFDSDCNLDNLVKVSMGVDEAGDTFGLTAAMEQWEVAVNTFIQAHQSFSLLTKRSYSKQRGSMLSGTYSFKLLMLKSDFHLLKSFPLG